MKEPQTLIPALVKATSVTYAHVVSMKKNKRHNTPLNSAQHSSHPSKHWPSFHLQDECGGSGKQEACTTGYFASGVGGDLR
jgi:hypothetical protein